MSEPSAAPGRNLDLDRFRRHFRLMARIRAFEEAAVAALKEGLVLGAIHPSIGQEAIAAGVCGNLEPAEVLLSTHRGHGHTLAKGADVTAMMAELFGRAGGTCQGKGGSMHIADFAVGMLGANGVVGANIGIAAGAAHALKLRREERIVCCLFGDGAINRGPFLEGLNWAALYGLRVLFVCEDNGFAATTRTGAMSAGPGALARAEALGIPGTEVDGNDIAAIDEAARELILQVRETGAPRFLLARTYRLSGHTGADAAPYRDPAEVEAKWRADPLQRCAALLIAAGVDEAEIGTMRAEAEAEIREAYARAKAAPWPDLRLTYADVQDVGAPEEAPH
jgi:acetoin:2,6-dichlorophenolindophenol oxidoreductase subunit alpha